jgi:hypothetical protein
VISEVPFPVNLIAREERKKLEELGRNIAKKEKLHYEGYTAVTHEPYSIENAKATLVFN